MPDTAKTVTRDNVIDLGEDGDAWAFYPPGHVGVAEAVIAIRGHLDRLQTLGEYGPINTDTIVVAHKRGRWEGEEDDGHWIDDPAEAPIAFAWLKDDPPAWAWRE